MKVNEEPAAGAASVRHVAVLIPARNEEDLLPRCLRSVQIARALLPADCSSDVVVVSDCSQDRTREIAEDFLGTSGCAICINAGMVGQARAAAAQAALLRFAGKAGECWFANTDADCEVPPSWLIDQLRSASRGVQAVAGIVDVHDFSEHRPHVAQRFRDTYLIAADRTHPHVHGANLGVRADAYLQAGGWGAIATAEDHDLWKRLQRSGAASISDADLQVITSGRRTGRAPLGFANALAAHNEYAL